MPSDSHEPVAAPDVNEPPVTSTFTSYSDATAASAGVSQSPVSEPPTVSPVWYVPLFSRSQLEDAALPPLGSEPLMVPGTPRATIAASAPLM